MIEFHEKHREAETGLVVLSYTNQTYPTHFHNNIEVLLCTDSCYEITQNGHLTVAEGGFLVFTDSYVPHAYRQCRPESKPIHSILIPRDYQHRFRRLCAGKRPVSTVIYDDTLLDQCLTLIRTCYRDGLSAAVDAAIGELLLALIFPHLTLEAGPFADHDQPIVRMLSYIDEHFRETLTLGTIAVALGYRPEYLSRVFHATMGTNLKAYINRLRLNALLKSAEADPEKRLSELVYEAGFNSMQSYYRCKALERQNAAHRG